MAKPDLGNKHKCLNCGTKFFDMNKNPITCPKCGTVLDAEPTTAARGRLRDDDPEDEETGVEENAEVVSLEDASANDDGKAAPSDTDEDVEEDDAGSDDDDTFLEEEEEDDGDVSNLIDGDIEDDEER